MTYTILVVLLVAFGVAVAYVAPDDHTTSFTGRVEVPRTYARAKPEPLSAQQADLNSGALRYRRGDQTPRSYVRQTRGVDNAGSGSYSGAGSFSTSGGGGGGYQTSGAGNVPGFGFPTGNQYPYYPFHNPNPAGFIPMDFGSFFTYLQQMQNAIQQNAVNHGVTNSYGIATRNGVFGPNGYGSVSSGSYSGNGIGFGNGGGGGGTGYGGSFSYAGNGGGNDGSNYIGGYNQGGQGSQGGNNYEGASAVASIGPQGGYGSANLNPDIGTRFGSDSGQFPASNGGNVGVFTGSASGSSNINGQTKTFRTATSGHIDGNGKVTSYTVRDPPQG